MSILPGTRWIFEFFFWWDTDTNKYGVRKSYIYIYRYIMCVRLYPLIVMKQRPDSRSSHAADLCLLTVQTAYQHLYGFVWKRNIRVHDIKIKYMRNSQWFSSRKHRCSVLALKLPYYGQTTCPKQGEILPAVIAQTQRPTTTVLISSHLLDNGNVVVWDHFYI